MSDYSELKRLLEACKESNCADESDFGRRIADLYDYLDPETVSELLDDLEGFQQGAKAEADAGDEARNEVCKLKAENEALRKTHQSLRQIIKLTEIPYEGALSQFDLMRKDAERYQFLKNLPDDQYLIERLECATDPENWDEVIDAAMAKAVTDHSGEPTDKVQP
jgi:hypothetical protein